MQSIDPVRGLEYRGDYVAVSATTVWIDRPHISWLMKQSTVL